MKQKKVRRKNDPQELPKFWVKNLSPHNKEVNKSGGNVNGTCSSCFDWENSLPGFQDHKQETKNELTWCWSKVAKESK